MRSRPRHSQNCRSNTCAHCSWPVCVQVWRRVSVAAVVASRFQFWLGLSLGYGLDYLLVMVWTLDQLLFGALSLEKEVRYLVWLSSLGFASGMILCQG
jgi:hypothetical protein